MSGMQIPSRKLSAINHNLAQLARRDELSIDKAARQMKFAGQSVEASLAFLLEEYERNPYPLLLQNIGDLYVTAGQRVAAESIFRRLYHEAAPLHVSNLIYAGIPATRALVDDKARQLFIPIPKCGSSTVKNYFTAAIHDQSYGELVHFKHPELYRIITPEEMRTTYRKYFRFAVVRDPLSRLVSYYITNIRGKSLVREAMSQSDFQGFPTLPGPHKFAVWFHQYRQFFKDFRHHTDPIGGYLDPFRKDLDRIYTMSELPKIRKHLSKVYRKPIDDFRTMVSKPDTETRDACAQSVRMLKDWYERDYFTYM